MILFSDIIEEYNLRYGPYPAGWKKDFIHEVNVPRPDSLNAEKACSIIQDLRIPSGTCLFKYGQYEWLEQAKKKGNLRISPAANYNDPTLNHAIQDDELRISINPCPSFKLSDFNDNPAIYDKFPGKKVITLCADTNYYVFCVASVLTPRLFLDFEADACLVIFRPKLFRLKLFNAFRNDFPDWEANSCSVKYIDPLNATADKLNVFTCKHFRYSYQKEARLIWTPERPISNLSYFNMELGSLEDCCTLVRL